MSHVGKNIRKIRTVKKLSQAAFAELFGLARPSVGAYEEGRSEPKMETLIQIALHFGLSVDLLLTKELTVNDLYGFERYQQPDTPATDATASEAGSGTTPYVPTTRLMEYIVRHHDAAFVQGLANLTFPPELGGVTRAFEMQGADMQPTVRHQDVLLTCRVDKATLRLRAGRLYAFVLQNQLLVRRLLEHRSDNVLRLRADNPDYPVQDVPFTDALEVWEVQGVFSTYLRPPALVEERVTRLERQVEELLARLG
ncbi:XRE family transcriptional regulator [Hymenobacter glacieicola]|uniref:HTH cro/C1-type domain-containing protein n=1 Tax=Hymenobacter glacieicola TaxID=1562124 RepID=A0ABQ1X5M1_9BACT|nr:LexA family transcriptional regulator [Hymenobacter glacieicola]GGG57285.1 hypothetical protein GCM10011378_36740 [Hymenobacter glacieicola]